MVSMSSTPSTAKNEKSTQSLPKKRTADQAGLDQAIADALSKKKAGDVHSSGGQEASKTPDLMGGKDTGMEGKDVSGKDWLLDQVAKMETAFKVCRVLASGNNVDHEPELWSARMPAIIEL
ncbi:hypothetical protein NCC49_005018 [Naganishia albida]|nr:hypothetical protein NCC49_005018 [Naganishia albida]